jgi:hypothetical protein
MSTLTIYNTYNTESTNEYFIRTKRGGEKGGGRERQRTEVVLCRQGSNQATSAKILTGRKDWGVRSGVEMQGRSKLTLGYGAQGLPKDVKGRTPTN